jgi:hypothetical protein
MDDILSQKEFAPAMCLEPIEASVFAMGGRRSDIAQKSCGPASLRGDDDDGLPCLLHRAQNAPDPPTTTRTVRSRIQVSIQIDQLLT